MDGFAKNENVFVLAATNMPQALDPALTRSGRFDKSVNISLPSIEARTKMLKMFTTKMKIEQRFDFESISKRTMGFSGADLKNLANIAAIHSVRLNQQKVNTENFDYAFNQVMMGIRSQRGAKDFSEYEKKAIAIHEAGHTIVNLLTDGLTKFYKVTILPAGNSLGHTAMTPKKDFVGYTKEELINQVDIKLGGRAAEELYLGVNKVTSGCGSDLSRATSELYSYLRHLGMEEDQFLQSRNINGISDQVNFEIDCKVESILKERYEVVKTLISENKKLFDAIVEKLVEKETLSSNEIEEIRSLVKKN